MQITQSNMSGASLQADSLERVTDQKNATSPRNGSAGSISGDTAQLSQAATLLSNGNSLDPTRAEKVTSIANAVASGSYRVSSDVLASAMIRNMLQNGRY